MAQKREKMTLILNSYESEKLNSIQNSFLLAQSWFSMVPSINEILKGMVTYAYMELKKDGRVRRGFANRLFRKRNYPLTEEEAITSSDRTEKIEEMIKSIKKEQRDSRTVQPTTANYSFYFELDLFDMIDKIRSWVIDLSKVPITNISNPEIVRECLHYVIDRDGEYVDFRYLTFIGSLYDISPSTSATIGNLSKTNTTPEKWYEFFAGMVEEEELDILQRIREDEGIFEDFQNAYKKNYSFKEKKHYENMFGEYISKVKGFDFYLALFGSEMNFYLAHSGEQSITEAALETAIYSEKNIRMMGLELFSDYLGLFMYLFEPDETDKKESN